MRCLEFGWQLVECFAFDLRIMHAWPSKGVAILSLNSLTFSQLSTKVPPKKKKTHTHKALLCATLGRMGGFTAQVYFDIFLTHPSHQPPRNWKNILTLMSSPPNFESEMVNGVRETDLKLPSFSFILSNIINLNKITWF